jgi:hypothetical protein
LTPVKIASRRAQPLRGLAGNQAGRPPGGGLYAILVTRVVLEPLDFVLETQFLTLQLSDFEVVGDGSRLLLFDFPIQCAMFLRQLNKVCVERHV